MVIVSAHIVKTENEEKPYKVVIEREGEGVREYPVESMKDGEALIREKAPTLREEPFPEGSNL